MTISDAYGPNRFGLSFELFPPKTPAGDAALFATLDRLTKFQPGFISCTYGAGGSTSKRTVELCVDIQRRYAERKRGAATGFRLPPCRTNP